MDEQDRSWIKTGAKVAIYTPGTMVSRARVAVVERLTATQAVVGGDRYRLSDLREIGRTGYGTPRLAPLTDERVQDAFALQALGRLVHEIDQMRRRDPHTHSEVAQCLDAIAGQVAATKARVAALAYGIADNEED